MDQMSMTAYLGSIHKMMEKDVKNTFTLEYVDEADKIVIKMIVDDFTVISASWIGLRFALINEIPKSSIVAELVDTLIDAVMEKFFH